MIVLSASAPMHSLILSWSFAEVRGVFWLHLSWYCCICCSLKGGVNLGRSGCASEGIAVFRFGNCDSQYCCALVSDVTSVIVCALVKLIRCVMSMRSSSFSSITNWLCIAATMEESDHGATPADTVHTGALIVFVACFISCFLTSARLFTARHTTCIFQQESGHLAVWRFKWWTRRCQTWRSQMFVLSLGKVFVFWWWYINCFLQIDYCAVHEEFYKCDGSGHAVFKNRWTSKNSS